jgi:formylglycine-generating enzyme required for sulfatase activity
MSHLARMLAAAVSFSFVVAACEGRSLYLPPTWVRIERGSFLMGTPTSESCREPGKFKETQHRVTLTTSFEISTTEVTQGQFEHEVGRNPSTGSALECGPDCPVDHVSWHDAVAYCNRLSRAKSLTLCYACAGNAESPVCAEETNYDGRKIYSCPGYRLPTEAEWEYACRAGTTAAYYSGPAIACDAWDGNASAIGWYTANSGVLLHLAGLKQANAWGLHDMSGSVWEWVHDWFQLDLGAAEAIDPAGGTQGASLGRGLRGGSVETPAQLLRSGSRYNYTSPEQRFRFHGFRCVRSVP